MLQTTILSLLALAAFAGLLMASVVQYACQPYTPQEECKLGKYEIRLHRTVDCNSWTCGRTMAVAQGPCVVRIKHANWDTYSMPEAYFFRSGAKEPDYMPEGIELPAAQSTVCEVK